MKLNKDQKWFVRSGRVSCLGFAFIISICLLIPPLNEIVPAMSAVMCAWIVITLINIWIFKDDKVKKKREYRRKWIKGHYVTRKHERGSTLSYSKGYWRKIPIKKVKK